MNRTLFYTLLILIIIVVLGEGLTRFSSVQESLPEPSWGTAYKPVIRQLEALEKSGGADCLLFGNSMVQHSWNPRVFEQAYQQATGQSIRCFTFGIPGLTASSAGPLAEILVKRYHPQFLIYGLEGVELSGSVSNPGEDRFAHSDWVRYARGEWNVRGWLLDHSSLYRTLDTLPEILTPSTVIDRIDTHARAVQGYEPLVEFANPQQSPLFAAEPLTVADYALDEADFEGFKKIVHLKDTRVLILNVPSYASQQHQQPYTVIQTAADYARQQGIPFWITPSFFPTADWVDTYHLYVTGAEQYSRWTAAQFGEAVRRGLFEPDAPPELLTTPPLENLSLDPLPRYGLSDENWRLYQEVDFLPPDAVVFDPSNTALTVPFLQESIGLYLTWHVNPSDKTQWFEFLSVLEQTRGGEYAAWRVSKRPVYLEGVDYLLYSDLWLTWLSQEETRILHDPRFYELVASWTHPSMPVTYFLYRVVK